MDPVAKFLGIIAAFTALVCLARWLDKKASQSVDDDEPTHPAK